VRAIGYASLNTINPQPTQLGLGDQEQMIPDYVRKRDWELTGMYSEVKNTNSDLNHPQLERVRKAAVRGEFDVLVIARLDRITRNIRYLNAVIAELCLKHDVGLISIEEGLDTSADSGPLAINIIDIFTKWDSKRISDRTREIIAKKRERGERVGHAPFGYTYSNKKLVEVAEEQRIAELIRKKRDQAMSYHKIARMLNEESIASKRGGIWYAETVKTVYQNLLSRQKAVNE
jgi:DNA invertase Pin-like site-specific DNA recombinase